MVSDSKNLTFKRHFKLFNICNNMNGYKLTLLKSFSHIYYAYMISNGINEIIGRVQIKLQKMSWVDVKYSNEYNKEVANLCHLFILSQFALAFE